MITARVGSPIPAISLQMENKWPFQSAWKIVGPTG